MGTMVSLAQRELTDDEVKNVIDKTYHAWRGEKDAGTYEDKARFCKAVKIDEIEKNGWILTPGRYVGSEEIIDDGAPFEERIMSLKNSLHQLFEKNNLLQKTINSSLEVFK